MFVGLSCYPSFEEPLFIIKIGPPGSGKSSSNPVLIRHLGINPDDALTIDYDKITASFKNFRNQTRNIRKMYNTKPINNDLYKLTSALHRRYTSVKNKATQKPISQHVESVISHAIRQQKNIIYETIRPINNIIKKYKDMLHKNKYKIIVIFHMADGNTLKQRILERGEKLYQGDPSYYRAFNMPELPYVIENLMLHKEKNIIPAYKDGTINTFIDINGTSVSIHTKMD